MNQASMSLLCLKGCELKSKGFQNMSEPLIIQLCCWEMNKNKYVYASESKICISQPS